MFKSKIYKKRKNVQNESDLSTMVWTWNYKVAVDSKVDQAILSYEQLKWPLEGMVCGSFNNIQYQSTGINSLPVLGEIELRQTRQVYIYCMSTF